MLLVAPVVAGVLALVSACGGDTASSQKDPVLAKGEQIHRGRCAACHGVKGGGGTGKQLNGGAISRDLPDAAEHRRIVADGVPDTAMAAWKDVLTAEEIDAVVRYQREVIDKIAE